MRKYISVSVVLLLMTICCNAQVPKNIFGDMRARSIGPALMSGRITDIDVVKKNPQVIYIGTAGGGVWKSVSAGTKVDPVFDEHTMSIGKVTIDQRYPDTVWVGTGESWVRNSVGVGTGVYKSVDGGASWQNMGLQETEHISDIIIDPRNSNVVYVAAQGQLWSANQQRGVYKTTDGGKTWNRILFIDENTGCADIDIDPDNPDIIYAAMWSHRRYADFFDSGFTGTSGLFKSEDEGKSWQKIHNGLPPTLGRIGISVAPSNPQILYASIETRNSDDKGLYKSWDKGEHWTKVNTDFNNTVRPFYFSRIIVDPNNDSTIIKCAFVPIMSTDGGKKFRTLNGTVHSDIHAAWIDPHNHAHILLGTDGGVYESFDHANSFRMWMNLPVGQFYHVAVDNEEPYNIYGGLQDGANWYAPSHKPGGLKNGDWNLSLPGDGFNTFAHPRDNNIMYAEIQGGGIFRLNKKSGEAQNVKPLREANQAELRFNWNTPLVQSTFHPDRIYTGSQFVHVSDDRGDSWRTISDDLTTNDPARQRQRTSGGLSIENSAAENNTTISVIAESPLDEQVLWTGSDDGLIQLTRNGGKNWARVSDNIVGLPKGGWCSSIAASRHNISTAYVSFDNHRSGDKNPYIFKTTDMGKTWAQLPTHGLDGFVYIVKEDLVNPDLLFAGTEFGLFISIDAGISWNRFSNNLPRVAVHDMVIHPRTHDLVLATHGRSIYIIDDITPLRQLKPDMLSKSLVVFPPSTTIIQPMGGMGAFFGGDGDFVAESPNVIPKIYYYLNKRHTLGKLSIKVYKPDGSFVKELTPGKNAGINMVEMVTRKPKPKTPPSENLMSMFGAGFGPPMEPSTYKIEVTKDEQVYETTFSLQYAAHSSMSAPEIAAQQELIMRAYSLLEKLAYMYAAQDDLAKQLQKLKVTDKKAVKLVKNLTDDLHDANALLVFQGGDFYVDQGMRLTEQVLEVYTRMLSSSGKIGNGLIQQLNTLEEQYDLYRRKFAERNAVQVQTLNSALKTRGLKTIMCLSEEDFRQR